MRLVTLEARQHPALGVLVGLIAMQLCCARASDLPGRLRFRRSVRLHRRVALNVGVCGPTSMSVRLARGCTLTMARRPRLTVSLPGSGLAWVVPLPHFWRTARRELHGV